MVPIKTNTANKGNYGGVRSVSSIKFIVIHYTGNDGDTDESNANYFKNNVVKSSAHYFVDDDSITQSVPDNCVAWAVGGNRYASYKTTGGAKFYNVCTNANSISIELCDDVKDGKISPSAKTITNALDLTKMLMKKYNIPASKVIRHFDVTGKICPGYWAGDSTKNALWLKEFWNKLGGAASTATEVATTTTAATTKSNPVEAARGFSKSFAKTWTVTATALRMRKGAGVTKSIIKTLKKGETFRCYGYYTDVGGTIWLLGVSADGKSGYCSKAYLK